MKSTAKTGFYFLLIIWIGMSAAVAENRFVSESCDIAVRSGPAMDRKIISMVPSGTSVEILTSGEDWCEVRLPSGKEGWAQSKELTTEVPSEIKLARLEKKLADTLAQSKDLQEKVGVVSTESKSATTELAQTRESLQKTEAAYEALKRESAEFLKFKEAYDKNIKELNETRQRAEKAENELKSSGQLTEGLLYGGGLVIFGFIAGFILKRPRRRSPLM